MTDRNGFDADQFRATVDAIREQPEAAKLKFQASYAWAGGLAGDAKLETVEQLGRTIPRTFSLPGDYPHELVGHDHGPMSFETLLAALGSCLSGTFAAQATAVGVEVDGIDIELEGHVDLVEFLGIAGAHAEPPGIRARVRVKSSADATILAALFEATKEASPCFTALTRPTRVETSVERV